MGYIKLTFSYLKKSFWALCLVALPAAAVLGLFTRPMTSVAYIPMYMQTDVRGFFDLFWLVFSKSAVQKVYPLFLIFAVLLFSCSLGLSFIETHFRVGRLLLKKPFKHINIYFLPVLLSLLALFVVLMVYGFLQAGVVTLLHFTITGKGTPNIASVCACAAATLGMFLLAAFLASPIILWAPMMVIYGYSFRDAVPASLRALSHNVGGVVVGLVFPFLTVALVECAVLFANLPPAAGIPVDCLLYVLLIVYLLAYIMVTTFDITGMTRRDNRKYYINDN